MKKEEEILSIIIPVYNSELTIKRAVDSVLMQRYEHLEIILVNDGSTDSSEEIIRDMIDRDSRIRLITTENRGVSSARNTGIKEATGHYLAFLDSDDFLDKDIYFNMIKMLEDTDSEMCMCKIAFVECEKMIEEELPFQSGKLSNEQKEDVIRQLCNYKDSIFSGSVRYVFKREFLNNYDLHFMTDISYQEDFLFVLETFLKIKQVCFYDKAGYFYVRNSMSAVEKFRRDFLDEILMVYDRAEVLLKQYARWQKCSIGFEMKRFQLFSFAVSNCFRLDAPNTLNIRNEIISIREELLKDECYNVVLNHHSILSFPHKIILFLMKNKMICSIQIIYKIKEAVRIKRIGGKRD